MKKRFEPLTPNRTYIYIYLNHTDFRKYTVDISLLQSLKLQSTILPRPVAWADICQPYRLNGLNTQIFENLIMTNILTSWKRTVGSIVNNTNPA
jgi:hypothetical protein